MAFPPPLDYVYPSFGTSLDPPPTPGRKHHSSESSSISIATTVPMFFPINQSVIYESQSNCNGHVSLSDRPVSLFTLSMNKNIGSSRCEKKNVEHHVGKRQISIDGIPPLPFSVQRSAGSTEEVTQGQGDNFAKSNEESYSPSKGVAINTRGRETDVIVWSLKVHEQLGRSLLRPKGRGDKLNKVIREISCSLIAMLRVRLTKSPQRRYEEPTTHLELKSTEDADDTSSGKQKETWKSRRHPLRRNKRVQTEAV
jgi:hypothetical protein